MATDLWRSRRPGAALDSVCRCAWSARASIGGNFAQRIGADFRECRDGARESIRQAIDGSFLVIHGAGPFQGAGYDVAELCIESGIHYLDLAGPDFVVGIGRLDASGPRARADRCVGSQLDARDHIRADQPARPRIRASRRFTRPFRRAIKTRRGEATIAAVLSYLGRTIRCWRNGTWVERPGWGDATKLNFPPPVGRDRVHNCEVSELNCFHRCFKLRRCDSRPVWSSTRSTTFYHFVPCSADGSNLTSRDMLGSFECLQLILLGTPIGLAIWVKGLIGRALVSSVRSRWSPNTMGRPRPARRRSFWPARFCATGHRRGRVSMRGYDGFR